MTYPDDYINKVICGDCIQVMKQMPDGCVDLVVTDPPWNCGKNYGVYKDNKSEEEYQDFIRALLLEFSRISNNRISIVLGSEILLDWWKNFKEAKAIIIRKGAISRIRINNLFLQWKAVLINVDSVKPEIDLWDDIRWPGEGYFFNEPRYEHPAMTPEKLMSRIINRFTKESNTVFDPFCGSGTTAISASRSFRKFIGIEINSDYCKIAEQRLAQRELFT